MLPRRILAILTCVLCIAWFAGFLWFARDAVRVPAPPPTADGIVALTGGAERIATAIELLRAGRARKLLVSGVGPGAELTKLFRGTGIDPATLRQRITLGREATNTLGNAAEAAKWARENDVHSVIVVTAGYHMKRALQAFGQAMPGVTLYPAPVVPAALRGPKGLSALKLLAEEYTKWLASSVGLSKLKG